MGELTITTTADTWASVWLKTIGWVDTATHCHAALVGRWNDAVNTRALGAGGSASTVLDPDRPHYLCLVHRTYRPRTHRNIARNGHILLVPDWDAPDIEVVFDGAVVATKGLRHLTPGPTWLDNDHPLCADHRYHDCRNVHAAHYLHRFMGLANADPHYHAR